MYVALSWGDTSLATLRSYVRRKPPRMPRRFPFLSTALDPPASPFLPAYSERYRVTPDIIPLIMISYDDFPSRSYEFHTRSEIFFIVSRCCGDRERAQISYVVVRTYTLVALSVPL